MLALTVQTSGCSFLFVRGPGPSEQWIEPMGCTTGFTAPILDLAWVGYALWATSVEKTGGIAAEDIAGSIPWLASAGYGILTATQCRNAIEELQRQLPREPLADTAAAR